MMFQASFWRRQIIKYDVGVMLKSVDAMFLEKHFERLDMLLSTNVSIFQQIHIDDVTHTFV